MEQVLQKKWGIPTRHKRTWNHHHHKMNAHRRKKKPRQQHQVARLAIKNYKWMRKIWRTLNEKWLHILNIVAQAWPPNQPSDCLSIGIQESLPPEAHHVTCSATSCHLQIFQNLQNPENKIHRIESQTIIHKNISVRERCKNYKIKRSIIVVASTTT